MPPHRARQASAWGRVWCSQPRSGRGGDRTAPAAPAPPPFGRSRSDRSDRQEMRPLPSSPARAFDRSCHSRCISQGTARADPCEWIRARPPPVLVHSRQCRARLAPGHAPQSRSSAHHLTDGSERAYRENQMARNAKPAPEQQAIVAWFTRPREREPNGLEDDREVLLRDRGRPRAREWKRIGRWRRDRGATARSGRLLDPESLHCARAASVARRRLPQTSLARSNRPWRASSSRASRPPRRRSQPTGSLTLDAREVTPGWSGCSWRWMRRRLALPHPRRRRRPARRGSCTRPRYGAVSGCPS